MIDLENYVFNQVATMLRYHHNNITIYGEYVAEPASFPCVNMWESANSVWAEGADTTAIDNYVNVTYTIQVFTNSQTKKADAKALANEIDGIMTGLRFRRVLLQQVPNIDRTVYRIELRYSGLIKRTDFGTPQKTIYRVYPR